MNIISISNQIALLPETGCDQKAAAGIAADAVQFFTANFFRKSHLLGRFKHDKLLPRTVFRTYSSCIYLLQKKGGVELLGAGSFSKAGRVLTIDRLGSVTLKCGKSVFKELHPALASNEAAKLFCSPHVIPPADFTLLYFSEKKREDRLLLVGEKFAFDAASAKLRALSPLVRLSILADAASGLTLIHSRQFVHNDLKPENLFIRLTSNHQHTGVLGDLGMLRKKGEIDGHQLGSAYWWAPEAALELDRISQEKDIWAFGIVLFQLLKKNVAEGDDMPSFLLRMESSAGYDLDPWILLLRSLTDKEVERDLFPDAWSILPDPREVELLIRECLRIDPHLRPTAMQLNQRLKTILQNLTIGPALSHEMETKC